MLKGLAAGAGVEVALLEARSAPATSVADAAESERLFAAEDDDDKVGVLKVEESVPSWAKEIVDEEGAGVVVDDDDDELELLDALER